MPGPGVGFGPARVGTGYDPPVTTAAATSTPRWRNWGGNERCVPRVLIRPRTEEELAQVVRAAFDAGGRIRVAGSGHSFTPLVVTDETLVDLSHYGEILAFDARAQTVTVQAGITLRTLNRELARRGLALPNLGDIAYQTVAGAISTATHGTGAAFGNLATQVVGMRIVLGTGQVVSCDAQHNPRLLRIARVGLGALGAISTVTLQCVPAFRLHAIEEPRRVDEVLDRWIDIVAEHDHFEFFWIPRTGWALTKTNRRTDEPARPRPAARALRDELLVDNLAFGAMAAIGRHRNDLIPSLAKRIPSKGRVEYTDRSDRVFASARHVRFVEMEYAIPLDAVPEALGRLRALCDELGVYRSFPVEVRAVAADDIPLSPAYGRATGYIAVHVAKGEPYQQYFRGTEAIMDDYAGRPHWGKVHFQSADTLAPRYPEWDEFAALRGQVDPRGVFTNWHIDHVLGPIRR